MTDGEATFAHLQVEHTKDERSSERPTIPCPLKDPRVRSDSEAAHDNGLFGSGEASPRGVEAEGPYGRVEESGVYAITRGEAGVVRVRISRSPLRPHGNE